ncbi:MAG: hypothetical protein LBH43_20610 [Treponema sp.]|nr:hypothetical protein [Treponema sp.]
MKRSVLKYSLITALALMAAVFSSCKKSPGVKLLQRMASGEGGATENAPLEWGAEITPGGQRQFVHTVEFNNNKIPLTVYYSVNYTDPLEEYYSLDSLVFEYDGKKHRLGLEEIYFYDPDNFDLVDVAVDYNFDNYMDIAVLSGRGAYHSWYDIFIYNPEEKKYYYNKELSESPDVWVDVETQTVKAHGKGGHAGLIYVYNEYKWENGQLTLIYNSRQDYDEGSGLYILVKRSLQDGSWLEQTEAFRAEDFD